MSPSRFNIKTATFLASGSTLVVGAKSPGCRNLNNIIYVADSLDSKHRMETRGMPSGEDGKIKF